MVQGALPDPWCNEGIEQTYLVDAIVRLLQQAPPDQTTRLRKIGYVMCYYYYYYSSIIIILLLHSILCICLQSYYIESSTVKNTFKFVKANAFFFCCD